MKTDDIRETLSTQLMRAKIYLGREKNEQKIH
jgi:hypothetical protein